MCSRVEYVDREVFIPEDALSFCEVIHNQCLRMRNDGYVMFDETYSEYSVTLHFKRRIFPCRDKKG